jgi:hypothetical protein
MGKYLSKEVLCSAYPGTIYDDSSMEIFDFPGDEAPINLGRCFIEVPSLSINHEFIIFSLFLSLFIDN